MPAAPSACLSAITEKSSLQYLHAKFHLAWRYYSGLAVKAWHYFWINNFSMDTCSPIKRGEQCFSPRVRVWFNRSNNYTNDRTDVELSFEWDKMEMKSKPRPRCSSYSKRVMLLLVYSMTGLVISWPRDY